MIKMISLEWLLYAKAVHLVPSKLSSTVRLLGDELGAEDVHLLVTRVIQFWHEYCRAAIDTTVFTHFQNLFLRIFTFLNRNFNKLSTTEIATSPMLGEVDRRTKMPGYLVVIKNHYKNWGTLTTSWSRSPSLEASSSLMVWTSLLLLDTRPAVSSPGRHHSAIWNPEPASSCTQDSRAGKRRSKKISQSPLLGPFPGWKLLPELSHWRHY